MGVKTDPASLSIHEAVHLTHFGTDFVICDFRLLWKNKYSKIGGSPVPMKESQNTQCRL